MKNKEHENIPNIVKENASSKQTKRKNSSAPLKTKFQGVIVTTESTTLVKTQTTP